MKDFNKKLNVILKEYYNLFDLSIENDLPFSVKNMIELNRGLGVLIRGIDKMIEEEAKRE